MRTPGTPQRRGKPHDADIGHFTKPSHYCANPYFCQDLVWGLAVPSEQGYPGSTLEDGPMMIKVPYKITCQRSMFPV
jgi:hypothetical protein